MLDYPKGLAYMPFVSAHARRRCIEKHEGWRWGWSKRDQHTGKDAVTLQTVLLSLRRRENRNGRNR